MSEINNEELTAYLDAATNMGFEGSSFIQKSEDSLEAKLYLCGTACRLAYQDVPEDGDAPINVDDIKCVVQDLSESVPAKMIIAENHEGMNYKFWLQGPVGSGISWVGDFDDCLLEPIEIEDVEDFKRLYPLVIDVLAAEDITPDELKQKAEALCALIVEFELRQAPISEEAAFCRALERAEAGNRRSI
jgi:hypothetical protein